MDKIKYQSVDQYLNLLAPDLYEPGTQMRSILREALPDAEEIISYNMPAYRQKKVLVYFAVYKGHIGFYPTGSGIAAFQNQLSNYKFSKGAIQFPIDQPLPADLIHEIARYRQMEVLQNLK